MEALIRAGAFDAHRGRTARALLASLGNAIEAADKGEQFAAQTSLFGGAGGAPEAFEMVRARRGASASACRTRSRASASTSRATRSTPTATSCAASRARRSPTSRPQFEPMMLAGVIYGVQMRNSRRGRMAVLTLDDGTARIEVVVFGELFHEKRAVIQEDQVVVVRGKVFHDEFSGGLRITADQLMDLAEVRAAHARLLRLSHQRPGRLGEAEGAARAVRAAATATSPSATATRRASATSACPRAAA